MTEEDRSNNEKRKLIHSEFTGKANDNWDSILKSVRVGIHPKGKKVELS